MRIRILPITYCTTSIILFCLLGILSCTNDGRHSEAIEELSPVITAEIVRFDQLLKSIPQDDLLTGFRSLQDQYPHFSRVLFHEVLETRTEDLVLNELEIITSDTNYLRLYNDVQDIYGDMTEVIPEISQALENYVDLFGLSNNQIPTLYTFISGFANQAFVFDDGGQNGLGLGLDMFLGSEFPYTVIHAANPSFSQYLVRTYNRDHIVKKITDVLIEDRLLPPAKADFLSLMIWGGKKLYLADEILNFVPDTIVTEYSAEQLQWCRNNEEQMWSFFFEQDLFYETDLKKFAKLIGPAPTSPGMPPESPGQTGNYMGWQIVRSYMRRNPDISIFDLIENQDAQDILMKSKYKPARR